LFSSLTPVPFSFSFFLSLGFSPSRPAPSVFVFSFSRMQQVDADRQIQQMIAFIAQEAREKAEEISVKTEKEFMADKLSLETQQAISIRADHEKMKKKLGDPEKN